jgi:hypothetical protein
MNGYEGLLNQEETNYDYTNLALKVYPEQANSEKPPKWGCLIHPDECRRIMFLGNEPLVTTRGTQLENFQLKNWIDMTVESFQNQIEWDIYPRLWRHRPTVHTNMRNDLPGGDIEPFAEWDDLYDFKPSESSRFLVRLRRKNVTRVHKWILQSPWTGSTLIDLKERMVPKYKMGLLEAVFVRTPWSNMAPQSIGLQAWRAMGSNNGIFPGAYQIDYTTGYDHAQRVPMELKEQILKFFTICVMSSFGDGIIGGVANFSTSVGVVHESLGTTMSATSAFFGARIKQLTDEINLWWKQSKGRYSGIKFGAL